MVLVLKVIAPRAIAVLAPRATALKATAVLVLKATVPRAIAALVPKVIAPKATVPRGIAVLVPMAPTSIRHAANRDAPAHLAAPSRVLAVEIAALVAAATVPIAAIADLANGPTSRPRRRIAALASQPPWKA